MNTKGQTDTTEQDVTENNADFNDIAKALNDGDYIGLDRLMAAEDKKVESKPADTSDEEVVEDEQNLTEEPDTGTEEEDGNETDTDTGKPDKETDVKNTEAADSAASTVKEAPQNLEQELHRLRSDAGRVPYMQRRLAELERELRAHKARTPSSSTDGTQTKPADLTSITLDEETQKEIDDLKETDPVMAKMFERVAKTAISAANSRADHVVQTFTDHDVEIDNEKFFLEQKAELTRTIPQHEAVFATPEWRQWKETLTPGFRAMAESGLASEVSQAIYAFAADMQRNSAATGQPSKVIPQTDKTSEVSEERARKVATSSEAKNPAAKKSQEFDEASYFSEMYKKLGKDSNILS